MDGNVRRRVNFFDVMQVLRGRSNVSSDRQEEYIQKAIDYFTSARDCQLYLDQKIISYDIKGGYTFASDNLSEFRETAKSGVLNEFGFISKDYLASLNKYIVGLHRSKNEGANKFEKEKLADFLDKYQRYLNCHF